MKDVLQPRSSWQPSQAPGVGRSMCTYNSEFIQRPLDALPATRELGQLFAVQSTQGQGHSHGSHSLPLSSDTTTRASYPAPAAAHGAGQSFKPAQEVHIDPTARFMESRSVFQKDFKAYNAQLRSMGRAELAKPPAGSALPLGGCGTGGTFEGRTSYARDYASAHSELGARRRDGRRQAAICEEAIWLASNKVSEARGS